MIWSGLRSDTRNDRYNQFASKDYIPSRGGMNVEWRRESTIPASTTALVEGSFPAETVATVVIVTASVAQYGLSACGRLN